jgi:dolichol-phosphate mannosyltransferase
MTSAAPGQRVLIVVPTYNERDNVERVVDEFLEPVPGSELLFVDDNSPDGTGRRLDELAEADPRVHVVHRPGKLGLGSAYVAGFRWGLAHGYDVLLEMDADFSHDPKYLPSLVERARTGADMVVGSRYAPGGGTENWGLARQMISRFGGLYARTVLGVPIRDMTAGFICYRRETLERIDLGAVRSNGYSFQIEMKYRVLQAGMRVEEIPIVFVDRRVGRSKMSRAIVAEALVVCWRLRFERARRFDRSRSSGRGV